MHFASSPLYTHTVPSPQQAPQPSAESIPVDPEKVVTPRSDLVEGSGPAATPSEHTANPASLFSTPNQQRSLPAASPPIPARSPLRPPAKSVSSQHSSGGSARSSRHTQDSLETPPSSAIEDLTIIVDSNSPGMPDRNSFPTIDDLLDAVNAAAAAGNVVSKGPAARPDSPISLGPQNRPKSESSSSSSSFPARSSPQSTMTKRQHALLELLSSERAYASDLALIREVHIPLALGQTVPLQNIVASPPDSSASSSRTLSTASDSSTASLGTPMTQDDVRIIFSNISELAIFSDMFSEELQTALGSLVDGGVGEDSIGELFCRIIPDLERPYQYYITRHPTALQHLQNLPQTPALQAYLSYTQTVASSLSHAWDLASLLIKPVQRLLKYPLLLSAVIDETPDSHPDKTNLKEARARMEEVARNVNEVRRRAEVIKDVLTSKKKPVNVTVAASVNLGKIKNLRAKPIHTDENSEAAQVERLRHELKRIELFAHQFSRNTLEWGGSMSKLVVALDTWAESFGGVIGLSREQDGESEAFDAFRAVIKNQLMARCAELEHVINETTLKPIAHLLKTMTHPYKLVASMLEQEPFHYHLLNMNVSAKNRPPPALLAASTNYLALRGQLAADLPTYINLLHKGLSAIIRRFADVQAGFWRNIGDAWGELWEMLRVEGELNAGYEETINVWHARWLDVDEVFASINITQTRKLYQEPERARPSATPIHHAFSNVEPAPSMYSNKKSSSSGMVHILSALEPSHSPIYTTEYMPSPPPQSRVPTRRNSNESLHAKARKSKGKSPARKSREDRNEYIHVDHYSSHNPYSYNDLASGRSSMPAIPRRKSMPFSVDAPSGPTRRATAPLGPSRYEGDDAVYSSAYINHPYGVAVGSDWDTGRSSDRNSNGLTRSPSNKRKSNPDPSPAAPPSAPNGKPQRPPTHNRNRSSSITSFFKSSGGKGGESERGSSQPRENPIPDPRRYSQQRDDWANKPAKYMCQVIHPCQPPAAVSYYSFPFFKLVNGDLYEILQEAGHPSLHPKLPLYVDDGEDCLLLCRDARGNVGWGLASFMEPVNIPR